MLEFLGNFILLVKKLFCTIVVYIFITLHLIFMIFWFNLLSFFYSQVPPSQPLLHPSKSLVGGSTMTYTVISFDISEIDINFIDWSISLVTYLNWSSIVMLRSVSFFFFVYFHFSVKGKSKYYHKYLKSDPKKNGI